MKTRIWEAHEDLYVESSNYIMRSIRKDDKEHYMQIWKEQACPGDVKNDLAEKLFPLYQDSYWENVAEDQTSNLTIVSKKNGEPVGIILLRSSDTAVPELEIDLLNVWKGRDIEPEVLPVTASHMMEHYEMEYFLVKISSDDEAKNQLLCDLGADLIDRTPGTKTQLLEDLRNCIPGYYDELIKKIPDVVSDADETYINHYRYSPCKR